jgi:carboxylesterase
LFFSRVVFTIVLLASGFAYAQSKCLRELETRLEDQAIAWDERYQAYDENFAGFELQNQASLSYGLGKKLAILVHGFMGSPDEMSAIGDQLLAQNYHVLNLLIPGFGGTARIANKFSHQMWTRWFAAEIASAKACSQQILLVGFSTGGLLIHDWLTKNPRDPAVKGAVLISPYFETSGLFQAFIQKTAAKFLTEVSLGLVNAIPGFYDVQIMLERPDSYLQSVPLTNSNEIVALGGYNQTRRSAKVQTPTLVMLSTDDQITDPDVAKNLTERTLAHRELVEYGPQFRTRVPHHMMCAEVSPVAEDLENRIIEFAVSL